MSKKHTVVPDPAIVKVKARCGHFDLTFLGPGQVMQIEGTYTLCNVCTAADLALSAADPLPIESEDE